MFESPPQNVTLVNMPELASSWDDESKDTPAEKCTVTPVQYISQQPRTPGIFSFMHKKNGDSVEQSHSIADTIKFNI